MCEQMKNMFRIYQKDLNSIVTNIMSIVLVGGLIFLPSLYAWLNIKASWDPYAQTDQIPIGFVNEDEGATVRGEAIHVGNDLEDELKENDNFKWEFVDKKTGLDKVEYGDYYALIVVPDDFSETLGSVLSNEPKKADMEYYVNEKINAIAPKITDKGASVIVEEISSEFISTVNGIIFEMFNDIGLELEDSTPDIERFESYVFSLEENLPSIYDKLEETKEQLTDAKGLIDDANERIPEAKSVIGEGLEAIQAAGSFLNTVESDIEKIGPALTEEVDRIEDLFSDLDEWKADLLAELDEGLDGFSQDDLTHSIDEATEQLEELQEELKGLQEELDEPNEVVDQLYDDVSDILAEIEKIDSSIDQVEEYVKDQKGLMTDLASEVEKVEAINLDEFLQTYEAEIEPAILEEISKGQSTVNDAENMVTSIQNKIPEIEDMLVKTEAKIDEGDKVIDDVLAKYPVVHEQVTDLADKIRSLQAEANLGDIIELLLNDPDAERNFFAEPVTLHKNEIFPIENYGTGMTPFYTVLSLWVGGLLLISLLSPNVPEEDKLNPKVVYGGRMLTFVSVGFLQTLIVTLGDIFIVGVTVEHKLAFIGFGLLISFVFMTIVYTAVAVLGDVGKAVAIILLVLQIASSGGTYPVVLLPEFFQAVHPYLPFTYGVDLMREAVGGIIWSRAWKDILALSIIATITIVLGTFLKGPVQAKMKKLMTSKNERLF